MTEYVKYIDARHNETASPHVLPPTSKAKGIKSMMAVRKATEEKTLQIHIGEGAAHALRRAQSGRTLLEVVKVLVCEQEWSGRLL